MRDPVNNRKPKDHQLKCWPDYFDPILSGEKNFDVREDDRDYQVGDVLVIREWDHLLEEYTGRIAIRKVTYKLHGGQFGIKDGYCVLGIKTIEEASRG